MCNNSRNINDPFWVKQSANISIFLVVQRFDDKKNKQYPTTIIINNRSIVQLCDHKNEHTEFNMKFS